MNKVTEKILKHSPNMQELLENAEPVKDLIEVAPEVQVEQIAPETIAKDPTIISKNMEQLQANIAKADNALMELNANDILPMVEQHTHDVPLYESPDQKNALDLINLENLTEDFKYLRDTLRENTDNGRKILNYTAGSILEGSDMDLGEEMSAAENQTNLIMSYAELNRAITDNLRLYIQAYKEISNIIINLEKVKQKALAEQKNTLNVNIQSNDNRVIKSTKELLEELRKNV